MAKRREVNYFKEINSDEELEKFLSQKGLFVLDVYQDLFGGTIALHGTLKKAKLTLTDSDKLHLGVCNAYKVDKLKRFKNKSQPTMIFCSNGKIVEIVYGSNIPLLCRVLKNQLELEDLYESGAEMSRITYEFDEPLPFEMEEIERKIAEHEAIMLFERQRLVAELHEKLDGIIKVFGENASEMGVTLFMPHVANGGYKKCLESSKWLGLISRARQTIQINPEMMETLNYKLENPFPDEILERIYNKDIFAVLWQNDNEKESIEKVLDEFVRVVSEPRLKEDNNNEEENQIAVVGTGMGILRPRILNPLIIYLEENDVDIIQEVSQKEILKEIEFISKNSQIIFEEEAQAQKRRSRISKSSIKSTFSNRISKSTLLSETMMEDENNERPKIVIPAIWSPSNQAGNAIFMYTFFRNLFDYFLPPEVQPEPEHLLIALAASKQKEIFELCQDFSKELLAFGFFSSGDFKTAKLICKTSQRYEQLPQHDTDRILMKVAHRTDHFVLALTTMNILYISQDTTSGKEECKIIFNEAFMEIEDVLDPIIEVKDTDNRKSSRQSQRRSTKPLRIMSNSKISK